MDTKTKIWCEKSHNLQQGDTFLSSIEQLFQWERCILLKFFNKFNILLRCPTYSWF